MCGLLGLFNASGVVPLPRSFATALSHIERRGPDDVGVWSNDWVHFGHRRLAIVDLTASGHQPMVSADGQLAVVFNGEIFNHRNVRRQLLDRIWRGTSDTETLMEAYRAWGTGCLARLNGMFALVIWDRRGHRVFAARDRLGVKPLFYHYDQAGTLTFASRPTALSLLTRLHAGLDHDALAAYLQLGYVPAPLSIQKGVKKLLPGHYLIADRMGLRCTRYWDFRHIAVDTEWHNRREDDLAEELLSLIEDAVRVRLLCDVPVGAFLSGGVDSSLVVSLMKRLSGGAPRTFTIGFDDEKSDESATAASNACHMGVEHTVEMVRHEEMRDLLPLFVDQFDEPFADSSAFPTMAVSRLASRSVKVALTGDGADELFGGYHYYPLMQRLGPIINLNSALRHPLLRVLRAMPLHRSKMLSGAIGTQTQPALFHFLRGVMKDYPSLLNDSSDEISKVPFENCACAFPAGLTAAEQAMRLDASFTLPDMYLQKVDLASMAFSIEARRPMPDFRLVEWSMRLPRKFKLRGNTTKHLLKRVPGAFLPSSQINRPKKAFSAPVVQWLRGPLLEWSQDLLHDETLLSKTPILRENLWTLSRLQLSGERDCRNLIWTVLMLLCYVRRQSNWQATMTRALLISAYQANSF